MPLRVIRLPVGRDAHPVPDMGGGHRPALDDTVARRDLVMDGVDLVGERAVQRADEVLEALALGRHPRRRVVFDEVGRQELLDGFDIAPAKDLVVETIQNCPVVLLRPFQLRAHRCP
jgi:hypothetical protein